MNLKTILSLAPVLVLVLLLSERPTAGARLAPAPLTDRLRADWRERMEDMLWSRINTPEFVFVP